MRSPSIMNNPAYTQQSGYGNPSSLPQRLVDPALAQPVGSNAAGLSDMDAVGSERCIHSEAQTPCRGVGEHLVVFTLHPMKTRSLHAKTE